MNDALSMSGFVPLWILLALLVATLVSLATMPRRAHRNVHDEHRDQTSYGAVPSAGLSAERI
jgi:hypothetical protein